MKISEDEILISYFDWVRMKENGDERYSYIKHVPNEANRGKGGHIRAVAKGLRRGYPDVDCPYPYQNFKGLAIEVKTEKGSLTLHQLRWLDKLSRIGWFTIVARSFEEMKLATEWYFGR